MSPSVSETAQLLRLRALRVRRAEQAVGEAERAVEAAALAVEARRRAIARWRAELDALERAIVGELAPRMARWAPVTTADRDRIVDGLERDEDELAGEEHALDTARAALADARTALSRARAREDVVRDLARDARRTVLRGRDARAELELEDRRPAEAAR